MPGDYPPRRPGGSWDQRADNPRERSNGPRYNPGASGQRPGPTPGRSGVYRPNSQPGPGASQRSYGPYRGPGVSGQQRAMSPYGGAGAPGAWRQDPFAASMAGGFQTSAHLESIQRKRNGFALFHDGNAGHLWRGEVSSILGESILSAGIIIWLAYLTSSPLMVALGVLSLGLAWLAAAPFVPFFERSREPSGMLRWLGLLRMLLALGIVGMHFLTIYPILYLLLFGIGFLGRLRQALRVAATRVCLEPGEVELVANDVFIGSALATVIGPLLAAALFLVLGGRVILVALAVAGFFLLASNSDGFLDAIPEERRAFTHATPSSASPDETLRDELIAAARGDDGEDLEDDDIASLTPDQRERALPEWYQQGPGSPFQAIEDVRAGLRIAGARRASATALLTVAALALVGAGLSVLEVFYVTDRLGLPAYYLGVLAALEAGGLTIGAVFASAPRKRAGGGLAPFGLLLTGVALVALAFTSAPIIAYGIALALGIANGLSVTAARRLLRARSDGVQRRALGAAESFIAAVAGVAGAILFTAFYAGSPQAHIGSHALFPGLSIVLVLGGAGGALILAGAMFFINPGLRERAPKVPKATRATSARMAAAGASGRFPAPGGLSGKMGAVGVTGETGAVGALWGDDDMGAGDDYDDENAEYDEYDDEDDDWDDRRGPARGRGAPRPGGRPPSGPSGRRGRW